MVNVRANLFCRESREEDACSLEINKYFKLADMKGLLAETDQWARRRIRAVYWKQWKKPRTRYRMLRALKCEHWVAREMIRCRKGYWRMAQVIGSVFKNEIVVKLGYTSMLDYYLIVREN